MRTGAHTVLLDADGVLQWPQDGWLEAWRPHARGDLDAFMTEMFTAELPALEGREDLHTSVARFLRDTGRDEGAVDEICSAWTLIDVFDGAFDLLDDLRSAGTTVHLASNQQTFRRDAMLGLGYGDHVDHAFFSCDLGVAKPAPDYFRALLRVLRHGPEGVVFVDDRADNVAAARSVGLDAHVHRHDDGPDRGIGSLRTLLRDLGVAGA